MTRLDNLFDQVRAFDRPPVETWFPQNTVEFDLTIATNGDWIHEGEKITRHKLVKLFSTVLALRDGQHYLITPPTRYRIQVEDAPFLAVELKVAGNNGKQQLVFRTNMDEVVVAGAQQPLVVNTDPQTGEPQPYLEVRDGLRARLTRPVFYQVVDIALQGGVDEENPGIHSDGVFFQLA